MQIGKSSQLRTSISTATPDSITVRNRDLCKELIGHVSLTEFFCLLLTGQPPTDTQRLLLDASLVAISEHGLVPSIQAARSRAGVTFNDFAYCATDKPPRRWVSIFSRRRATNAARALPAADTTSAG